ncbi:MAG: GatB/YqeY domain-containing protein [bacterium]|nr:GatB/YqeY domain-containing protein [Myxococcales bacterium]MCB9543392.1 GatB/YqeY domain-containing protein [Myxococcales bacterium]
MSLQARIDDELKTAMRARDKQRLDLLRMIKSKVIEARTAPGFSGEIDDALYLSVIETFAKSQRKALEQYRAAGPQGAEHVAQIEWELARLDEYLPQKADEATVRGWVQEAIAGLGGKERAKLGQVIGVVMKAHKADADPAMVRAVVEAALA